MGIKLLSNYPLKRFDGVAIPNVEITCRAEFRQEKRDVKYILTSTFFIYNNPEHVNSFEIIPMALENDVCPVDPLRDLYNAFKERQLSGLEYIDN